MGGLEEVLDFWLQIGPASAIVTIWGASQWMEDRTLPPSLYYYLLNKNKYKKKKEL